MAAAPSRRSLEIATPAIGAGHTGNTAASGRQVVATTRTEADLKDTRERSSFAATYAAFLLVGSGCGWFVCNALGQTLANEPPLRLEGRMFGEVALVQGIVGLVSAAAYFWYLATRPDGFSLRTGQRYGALLISVTVASFLLLTFFWDVSPPQYPVYLMAVVAGTAVANSTYYVLFPLVATYYGGWLVAPIRAGTDISSLFTTTLAEVQNPSGTKDRFPAWLLFTVYGVLSCMSLAVWLVIVRYSIGLREEDEQEQEQGEQQEIVVPGPEVAEAVRPKEEEMDEEDQLTRLRDELPSAGRSLCRLQGLACPRNLLLPVLLATTAQVAQWGVVSGISQIGASMTDPDGCSGARGSWVYRTALTASNMLVPLASIVSSAAPCSRTLFTLLSLVQYLTAAAVCAAALGVQREWWMTVPAQWVYIACVALTGSLEGYLLTMSYRYIGDAEGISQDLRRSASSLLSFLGVIAVNPVSIVLGSLIDNSTIRCVNM